MTKRKGASDRLQRHQQQQRCEGEQHTPSIAFRHLPPNSEHHFPAPSSKDVVNQCLEFWRAGQSPLFRAYRAFAHKTPVHQHKHPILPQHVVTLIHSPIFPHSGELSIGSFCHLTAKPITLEKSNFFSLQFGEKCPFDILCTASVSYHVHRVCSYHGIPS